LKLMSLVCGEYTMLPLRSCARSISTFSCCSPSLITSTALVAVRIAAESRFHVNNNSQLARSTRN